MRKALALVLIVLLASSVAFAGGQTEGRGEANYPMESWWNK